MNESASDRTGVQSDETLFAIVEQLRETGGAGVTELATALDLAKSTVYDHLASMRAHGFVVREGDTYRLGLGFFSYGQDVRSGFDVYGPARAVVDDLGGRTDEMVWLFVHEKGRVMALYGHTGETDIDRDALIGSWAYMHCNSSGKAILAHLPESEVDAIVDRHGLVARTDNTITDRGALDAELDRIREQGYALNLGEDLAGIHAVAVPLLFDGGVRGALSIAGPAHRVTRERCESELVDLLSASRNEIELTLAYG